MAVSYSLKDTAKRLLTAEDFPLALIIKPVLDEQGLELPSDYDGISIDPFLTEALIQAIKAEKYEVFNTTKVPSNEDALTATRIRFGMTTKEELTQARSGDRVLEWPLMHLSPKDRAHYMVAVHFATLGKAKDARMNIIGAMTMAKKAGLSPIFSGEKMNLIITLASQSRSVAGTYTSKLSQSLLCQNLGAFFSTEELRNFVSSNKNIQELLGYVVLRSQMDMTSLEEMDEFLEDTPGDWMNELFDMEAPYRN